MCVFKKIYNKACQVEEKMLFKQYQINENNIGNYDLNKCINDNINDNNGRYLLLEIKSNLSTLIVKNIKIENPEKRDIEFINGSPFSDDNNKDYRCNKVNDIQEYADKQDKLIILQNLDQIQPYLYDLYNKNYQIIDEQKYVRICLDNFSEQLTRVNESFRIIILVDKKFINSVDNAFLNRLEKIQIHFSDLLDENSKKILKEILEDIKIKDYIKEEIGGLVYNLFIGKKGKKKIEESEKNDIKEKIFSKISYLLPQDIITVLPKNNEIKKKYEDKKYNNFKLYLNDLNHKVINYKISIIYTFSGIADHIEGFDNNEMEFMISEIGKENQLKEKLEEIITRNENKVEPKNNVILIHFEQFNSNKIQFISDYIMKFNKDYTVQKNKEILYNYIFLIHVQRKFFKSENKEKKELKNKKDIIYSIPNINNDINQLFIDNLNGPNVSLSFLLNCSIKDAIKSNNILSNFDEEFYNYLSDFIYEEIKKKQKVNNLINLNEENNEENYYNKLKIYFEEDREFKDEIIKKTNELIDIDTKVLFDKMIEGKNINKKSIDIVSCILNYYKENILKENFYLIFRALEDNNFFTTLIEIGNNDKKLDKSIIRILKSEALKSINSENKAYEPKFLFNYKIPGFYNFYKNISNDINKNITAEYFSNEKKLREYFDEEPEKIKTKFHDEEDRLLNLILENSQEKYKFYFDIIKKISEKSPDLPIEDYITFYLYNNLSGYSKSCGKLVKLLLKLRFSKEKNLIMKKYEFNPVGIFMIKVIWIESNANYIKSILNVFNNAKEIIINDKDGSKLYEMIDKQLDEKNNNIIINYIVDENRNPEHTREVNECFYKLLASLCLSLTSDEIKLTKSLEESENIKKNEIAIIYYNDQLKVINNILQILNDDLIIYLNELYIIDELIQIIDYKGININIKVVEKIRNYLRESSIIIQKNQPNKIKNLCCNFENLYNLLQEEKKDEKFKLSYYDTLKYILIKEIRKVNDIKYRATIINKLINEKEIIKKSKDIFQILLLDPYLYNPDFKKTIHNLLDGKDDIIEIIEKNLSDEQSENYFALSEALIYFFEKNSLIYLQDILKTKTLEDEPVVEIFKDSIKYLKKLLKNPKELFGKKINITKLFCLGYIKVYCFTFIKMHEKTNFKPDNIIEKIINKYDDYNMVKLYIYKIIYNQNNREIDVFINVNSKEKYKLDKYSNFTNFIKFEENEEKQFNYGIQTLDNDNYNDIYNILLNYKKDNEFNKKISNEEINKNGKLNFDNFYVASYNLILSDLRKKSDNSVIQKNFYENICVPLSKKENSKDKIFLNEKLLKLVQLLFDPNEYMKIKESYGIKPENVEALLFGYRYCLNEIAEEYDEEEKIFSVLYDNNKSNYLTQKLFPGSDTEDKQYYDLYYQIENHFKKNNNNAGCYICLCNTEKGYYHSISSGFPGFADINNFCPNCKREIGAKEKFIEVKNEKEKINEKIYVPIIRDNYYRIFKDESEINSIKKDNNKKNKLKGKYMTKKAFKDEYITPLYKQEKGLHKVNENKFKKDNKVIRNLSQISYRLLNYILYSHLFFAKLFLDSQNYDTKYFDEYLPGEMTWINTINECFILLQKELSKIGIKQIEIFMNLVFVDLFNKLHEQNCIDNYDDLLDFEDDLEDLINKKIEEAKKEIERYKKIEQENFKGKTSAIALLKEMYTKNDYNDNGNQYPYYEYFYYTDYLDEKYINNIFEHEDKEGYPMLIKYLEDQKDSKKDDDKYSLDHLMIFNQVLNLFSEKYSNKITKEFGETQILKDSDIYRNANVKLIDNFIKLYNNFELEDKEKKIKLKLNANKNYLCDFFLYDDNHYGKSYKKIYEEFIKKQNKELEYLFDIKCHDGVLGGNCKNKISVQQIKKNEIFTYNIQNNFNFIEILFDSSYRKIIDTGKYEDYNDFVLNLDSIETSMTESLLKGKKLLNNDLIEFRYNDEVFSNEISDLIFTFEHKYTTKDLNIEDEVEIYNYVNLHKGNNERYKNIINNFFILIEHLIKISNGKKDDEEDLGNSKISEVIQGIKEISKDFKEMFEDNKDDNKKNIYLTVNKTTNIFGYYLKLIFKYIKEDIKKYQEKKSSLDKKKLDSFFSKKPIINKESLIRAIRIFISVILYREKDKEKIKSNKKNIIGYLHKKDLWENTIYTNEKFESNMEEIKSFNIKINEILLFYNELINNVDEDFEKDVVEHLNNIQKEEEKSEEEAEKSEDKLNEEDSASDFGFESEESEDNQTNKKKRAK